MTNEEKITVIKHLVTTTDFLENLSTTTIDNIYSKIANFQTVLNEREKTQIQNQIIKLQARLAEIGG